MNQRLSTTTLQGKPRARYTLKCEFNDGNKFTYRSDLNHENYKTKGYNQLSELDALVLKFSSLKETINDAKLFDNSLPTKEDLLLHYGIGKVLLNILPGKYSL